MSQFIAHGERASFSLATILAVALAWSGATPALAAAADQAGGVASANAAGAPPKPETYLRRVAGFDYVALPTAQDAELKKRIAEGPAAEITSEIAARYVTRGREPARMLLLVVSVDPAYFGMPGLMDDLAARAGADARAKSSVITVGGRSAVLVESRPKWLFWLQRNFAVFVFAENAELMQSFAAGAIAANEDKIAPTSTIAISPEPAGGGWHQGAVTLRITAADNAEGAGLRQVSYRTSGADAQEGIFESEGSITISTEGQTTVNVSAEDWDGNVETSQQVTVRIDRTAPSITFTGNKGTYALYEQVAVSCAAVDDLSAVSTQACVDTNGLAVSFGLGEHTLSATATDEAGNTRTESMTYSVALTPEVIVVPLGAIAVAVAAFLLLRRRKPRPLAAAEPALPS